MAKRVIHAKSKMKKLDIGVMEKWDFQLPIPPKLIGRRKTKGNSRSMPGWRHRQWEQS